MAHCVVDRTCVTWHLDGLVAIASQGRMSMPLCRVDRLYRDSRVEFSQVRKEDGCDTLFMFHHDPSFDINVAKPDYDASMMAVGCCGREMRRVVDYMSRAIHLFPHRPRRSFIATTEQAVYAELEIYNCAKAVMHGVGLDHEKMFGLMHYAYFLKQYKRVEDPSTVAERRFGVPEGTIPRI